MSTHGKRGTPGPSRVSERSRAHTRSSGPVFDLDLAFPKLKTFQPSTMLPTLASVVGMLRYHTDTRGAGHTREKGVAEVAKRSMPSGTTTPSPASLQAA